MNLESFPNFEQPQSGREKLLLLEKGGKYVFHGSNAKLLELEPRQAQKYDEIKGINVDDGKPAVFATQYADAAIFRSLINNEDVSGDSQSGFRIEDDGLHFYATRNLVEAARNKNGKVYVLNKESFQQTGGMELKSEQRVVPVEIVEVNFEDLPQGIEIIEQ